MSADERSGREREVPSVAELRPVAQGAKTEADHRWTYRVFRYLSIYVTWALAHTGVTPNQVTIASLVIAGAGLVLVAMPGAWLAVAGGALLLLYHLLDRVDGELARYRGRFSLLGVYLDNAGHYLTAGGLLVAAAFRLAPAAAEPRLVWLAGSVGAIVSMMSRVEKHAPFHLFSQYVIERPDLADTVRTTAGGLAREALRSRRARARETASSPISMLGNTVLTLSWFPITVVILMAGFAVESAADFPSGGEIALYAVAVIQLVAYGGVEVANLMGNLGSETRRLARDAGLSADEDNPRVVP